MAVAPRVTIREIADRAGVSIATVSRVLNDRDDVSPETRELVSRVIHENRYTANRSARGLSRAHRPGRRPRSARLSGLLLRDPRRSGRGARRAGHRDRALADAERARARGPARPAHARHRPTARSSSSRGVERGARGGCSTAATASSCSTRCMPLDERIPSVSAANTSGADQAMRHLLHLGHRRIAGSPARRLDRDRGSPPRLPRRARGGRGPPGPGARGRVRSPSSTGGEAAASSSTWPTRRPRSSPSTTTSRSARSRRPASVACACPRTFRSSASTTSSTRRSSRRRSRPCASLSPRWAGPRSAC